MLLIVQTPAKHRPLLKEKSVNLCVFLADFPSYVKLYQSISWPVLTGVNQSVTVD